MTKRSGWSTTDDAPRFVLGRPVFVVRGGVLRVNEKQLHLIQGVQDILNGILENMEKDEFHAPAPWLLENLWATLEAVKRA